MVTPVDAAAMNVAPTTRGSLRKYGVSLMTVPLSSNLRTTALGKNDLPSAAVTPSGVEPLHRSLRYVGSLKPTSLVLASQRHDVPFFGYRP